MKENRKIIAAIGLIISFAFLLFSISLYYNYQHDIKQKERLNPDLIENMTTQEIIKIIEEKRANENNFYCFYLLPFIGFTGIIIGTITYYMMSEKIDKQEKTLKNNTKIILNFLTREEKKVIEKLLENDGKIPQYELSHLPNLNKVKTHRILENLKEKGIIKKERIGKINKIILNEELYKILK